MRTMYKIRIIKTEDEYREALSRLDDIFNAESGTPESDEADLLALIIEDYENKHYSIDPPDPIEAIRIRMEELSLSQKDLSVEFGGTNRVSEVLNKKRKLTLEMIRNISSRLHIPISVLVQDYDLST